MNIINEDSLLIYLKSNNLNLDVSFFGICLNSIVKDLDKRFSISDESIVRYDTDTISLNVYHLDNVSFKLNEEYQVIGVVFWRSYFRSPDAFFKELIEFIGKPDTMEIEGEMYGIHLEDFISDTTIFIYNKLRLKLKVDYERNRLVSLHIGDFIGDTEL